MNSTPRSAGSLAVAAAAAPPNPGHATTTASHNSSALAGIFSFSSHESNSFLRGKQV
ncbi:hypothetical protein [Paenibacillus sp. 32O-W]|uniref:hypothetical protein n=1 Tax=Paenibacillus sp. 32O-W TaxID=1695218 RepID=UPI000B1C05C0|nr:hypothetical protein [Paenibacillus sp. 32O-W]